MSTKNLGNNYEIPAGLEGEALQEFLTKLRQGIDAGKIKPVASIPDTDGLPAETSIFSAEGIPKIAAFQSIEPLTNVEANESEIVDTIDQSINTLSGVLQKIRADIVSTASMQNAMVDNITGKVLNHFLGDFAGARQAVDDVANKIDNDILRGINDNGEVMAGVQQKIMDAVPEAPNRPTDLGNGNPLIEPDDIAPIQHIGNQPPDGEGWVKIGNVGNNPQGEGIWTQGQTVDFSDQSTFVPYPFGEEVCVAKYDPNDFTPERKYWCDNGGKPSPTYAPDGRLLVICPCKTESTQPSQPPETQPSEPRTPTQPSIPKLTPSTGYPSNEQKPSEESTSCPTLEELEKKREAEKCKEYKIWQSESGVCYIQSATDSPRNPNDKEVARGTPNDSWVSILSSCGKPKSSNDTKPVQSISNSVPLSNSIGCLEGDVRQATIQSVEQFFDALGLTPENIHTTIKGSFRDNLSGQVVASVLESIVQTLVGATKTAIDATQGSLPCDNIGYLALSLNVGLSKLISAFTAGSFQPKVTVAEYAQNEMCPVLVPSGADAIGAWLANGISTEQLQCLFKVNSLRPRS